MAQYITCTGGFDGGTAAVVINEIRRRNSFLWDVNYERGFNNVNGRGRGLGRLMKQMLL